MAETPSLSPALCRQRQRRLREALPSLNADRVVLTKAEHVQYLTGFRPHPLMSAIVVLDASGHCTLIAPNAAPEIHAADEVRTFEAQWLCTLRQEQFHEALALVPKSSGRTVNELDAEPTLWKLRRRKDADELAMIRHAIAATDAMYRKAREIIAPGITELEVFNQLQAAAVQALGEPLTATGNDYQCNSPGGPPRTRAAQAGELFILDLGPAYRGYFADNCRTFSVDGTVTDVQRRAWEVVTGVLKSVSQTVRPGVSCRAFYEQAKAALDEFAQDSFFHHLGHGIGLYPHEAPHLNPKWDDVFEEGDVFTVEPGLYTPDLAGGMRIEDNYVVTATGVEQLTVTPVALP